MFFSGRRQDRKMGECKLLRRPLPPKQILPPISTSPRRSSLKSDGLLSSKQFDASSVDSTIYKRSITNTPDNPPYSPDSSWLQSIVSPPPPSESAPTRHTFNTIGNFASPDNTVMTRVTRDDLRYVLDPLYRGRTALGTYVDGKSLVKPFKPRGPDSFPMRNPAVQTDMVHYYDTDDMKYYRPPAFTLEHFLIKMSQVHSIPLLKMKEITYSRENYKKLTQMIADELNPLMCIREDVHSIEVKPGTLHLTKIDASNIQDGFLYRNTLGQPCLRGPPCLGDISGSPFPRDISGQPCLGDTSGPPCPGDILGPSRHSHTRDTLGQPGSISDPSNTQDISRPTCPRDISGPSHTLDSSSLLRRDGLDPSHRGISGPSHPDGSGPSHENISIQNRDVSGASYPDVSGPSHPDVSGPSHPDVSDPSHPDVSKQYHRDVSVGALCIQRKQRPQRFKNTLPPLDELDRNRVKEKQPPRFGFSSVARPTLPPVLDIGVKEARIPQQQLLIEMASMIKAHVKQILKTDVRSVIKPMPKYGATFRDTTAPHTEIILYEDDRDERISFASRRIQSSEAPGKDAIVQAPKRHFQGSERSGSPFVCTDGDAISPCEVSVLASLANGGQVLSLKAQFISVLPDLAPLMHSLVYLNISFNDFELLPVKVTEMEQLEVLKVRNNPLTMIPDTICQLKHLRAIVLSFCLLAELPDGVFDLESLEYMDLSYNKLLFIPNEIRRLKNLWSLNLEGNQLPAMSSGCTHLHLSTLNVQNNFMQPMFWKDSTRNDPQRLTDLAALTIFQNNLHEMDPDNVPEAVHQTIESRGECECCRGAMFGTGLKTIRPISKIFGIKNLPFMFHSCSTSCLRNFMSNKEALYEMLYGD